MKVFVAVFIVDGDDSAFTRQRAALKSAIETYGVGNIEGVTVGNEYMLNYVTSHGAEDATGTVGRAASTFLKTKITDIRKMLSDMGHGDVLVGSADAGSFFNDDLLGAIDFGYEISSLISLQLLIIFTVSQIFTRGSQRLRPLLQLLGQTSSSKIRT